MNPTTRIRTSKRIKSLGWYGVILFAAAMGCALWLFFDLIGMPL